jgi:chromosome segregation protein
MFAMFKFAELPFCVLDRDRRATRRRQHRTLRGDAARMQQHTQFIVITHSRKTMEIADRLYGVTMEEPGISS